MTDLDPVKYLEGLPRESSITDGEVRRMWELAISLPKESVFVELGVWQGRSAVLLAKAAQERDGTFYGIDHFQHPGCSRRVVLNRLEERHLERYAVLIEQSTEKVFWGNLRINFLHIDADHTSPGIDADCAKFLPLVRRRGIVCFDDYAQREGEPHYPDVKIAADRWCSNEGWEQWESVEGMGFFWRKP